MLRPQFPTLARRLLVFASVLTCELTRLHSLQGNPSASTGISAPSALPLKHFSLKSRQIKKQTKLKLAYLQVAKSHPAGSLVPGGFMSVFPVSTHAGFQPPASAGVWDLNPGLCTHSSPQ